ncbi:hypothetical protein JTB14_020010 [Gonioctena quinquepunctata]|nr:hypothetical protein JTB14_020010 [Gonioctena quinquepunctata]
MSSTDTADESTEMCLSPPRQRSKKTNFDIKTKEMILNVYKHETQENRTSLKGKGKRLIVCHIGSDYKFVPEALWAFESKKTGDYHEEMDGKSFEKWFENILPKLNDNCIVVLDKAPYHSKKPEKIPTTASRKSDIQDWLRSKSILFEETLLEVQLLAIVKEHRKKI